MSEAASQSQPPAKDLLGSYFLDLWCDTSKTLALKPETEPESEFEEEEEESPTALDTVDSSGGFSVVGPDKLSLLYPSVNLHGHDVGVVKANRPAPLKRLLYYFEIYVKNAGAKGQIAIGFTTSAFKLRRQPGYVYCFDNLERVYISAFMCFCCSREFILGLLHTCNGVDC